MFFPCMDETHYKAQCKPEYTKIFESMTSNPNVVWSDATLKPTLEPKFDDVDIHFSA